MKSMLFFCFVFSFCITWCNAVYYAPYAPKPKGGNVCYSAHGVDMGCFNNSAPFDDLPLPWGPDMIQPGFYLFSRQNPETEDVVRMDLNLPIPPEFDTSRESKIIIHGFLSSWESGWMHEIKDELLIEGDYNVILVDWARGAQVPLFMYENSASNIRVVSAYLAKLWDMVAEKTGYEMSKVHCIGHSLGGQTCGFFGKRVSSTLGRISGLDPAGPNFKDKIKEGRLDVSDADFVDIIHTNGRNSATMDFGIGQQLGDVDFVPNGGGIQPGCLNRRKRSSKFQKFSSGLGSQPSCSHGRACKYFRESINSPCPFTASPCPDMDSYEKGECGACTGDQCQVMGFHANKKPARGIFFLDTSDESPFCLK